MVRVGITHGDINGIGYEVIMKALSDERMMELCTPVIFGSSKLVSYYKNMIGAEGFNFTIISSIEEIEDGDCNFYNITEEELKVDMGQPTEASAKAAYLSLQKAVDALKNGFIDVLVTAPINKNAMQSVGFEFSGHTEYLESEYGNGYKAMMLLFNDDLRVALVTTHLPLKDIASNISKEAVAETIKNMYHTLRKDFTIENPKIAVLSLNPHSGDNGLLGKEEEEIIAPAIQESFDKKIMVFGPFAADGFFGNRTYEKFDGVVAMYHDQGLAPFKALAMETGVNFTAGLPFIRTSPDHGVGYDIVGKNIADPTSMREAIYKAIMLFKNRKSYIKSKANPLKKQYVDKSGDKEVLDLTKDEEI